MQLPYKPNAVRRGVNRHPTPCPAWFARGLTAGRLSLDERFPCPPLVGVEFKVSHGKTRAAGPSVPVRLLARMHETYE